MITFTFNEVTRQLTSLECFLIGGICIYLSYRLFKKAFKIKNETKI